MSSLLHDLYDSNSFTADMKRDGLIKKYRLIKIHGFPEFLIIWLQFQKKKHPTISWFPLSQVNYATTGQTGYDSVTRITLHLYGTGGDNQIINKKSFYSVSVGLTNSLVLKLLYGKVLSKAKFSSILSNSTADNISTDQLETELAQGEGEDPQEGGLEQEEEESC